MKRFLVSILGIFLLFGASLLTACGKDKPSLSLSQDTVAIQLYSENEDSSYQVVNADLFGVKEGSIRATVASGYENIVKVTTTNSSSTRASIRIEGLEEGTAQVVVRATPGDITKNIYVTVYSEVSSMSQVVEESGKKNNFLLLGEDNVLNEDKLISFYPVKGRKTITWSLHDNYVDNSALELNGNILHIADTFVGDGEENTLTLIAKTEKEVQTEITLPVVRKIEAEVTLGFSYSQNSAFEDVTSENNEFNIVPNIPTDDKYVGYILVGYTGDLDIEPYVLDNDGNVSSDLQVLRADSIEGKPLYSVYASKDKSDINNNYKVGFKIGYEKYNYYLDTIDTCPITIKAREMVNGIIISTSEIGSVAGSTQTLYTNYVESSTTSVNGKRYDISITPTTVVDATNKYSISVSRTIAGGAVSDGCPVEVWYRDTLNGDAWTQIILVPSANGDYVTREEDLPSVKTIYLKASNKIKDQTVDGFKITFTSNDNPTISTSFDLKLVKSVSLSEFAFDNADFRVDSSVSSTVSKKQFTLKGQTSIEGLYIINNSNNVVFDPIREVSFDSESVTFEVSFVLTKTGITSKDTYQIAHRNGLVAGPFNIDIFLPLKYSGMFVDSGENQSNSVIDSELNNKVYTTGGLVAPDSQIGSLSKLILKNNTTTPLLYTYNSVAGKSAVADISVSFFDFDSELDDLAQFQGLMSTPEGINRVIRGAIEKGDSSNIAYFNSDYSSIITKGVGHTYAVVSFIGKGIENIDENGNVIFVRVIYIESLVTPEGFNITPESDRSISLYSLNTVATEDEALTRKQITIKFAKSDITYKELSNLEFIAMNELMGNQEISEDRATITWTDGRYSISNISITGEGITFNILALDTFGDDMFTDTLSIHYTVKDSSGKKIYDIFTSISIVIRNAQRVEKITWKSFREDGLYFEVGDLEPQYVLLDVAPTNARNTNIAYIIQSQGAGTSNTFVDVSATVSSTTLAINLSNRISIGMTGYVYLLPADAIYNHQIKYYYKDGTIEKSGAISDNDLPNNYDFLVNNAYFKSNATGGEAKIVNFADILLKIKVVVADGKSFDYAYRIYDNDTFIGMKHDLYYTVMNNLDLTGATERGVDTLSSFRGGIQGNDETITVKLAGSNLAKTIGSNGIIDAGAEIRNITFIGDVNGGSFIAEENNGKITNVTVDVNGTKASTLTSTVSAGGIVGVNNGTISDCAVLGLNISAEGQNVGGIAGINNSIIKYSRIEFYNLESGNSYASNKFNGAFVGAIAGVMGNNSTIERTFAYDYTLVPRFEESPSTGSLYNVLKGNGGIGAFAGRYADNFTNATIKYSFSVVNATANVGGTAKEGLTLSSSYISYFINSSYNTTANPNDTNFVDKNSTDFKTYVNNGEVYLKELMQDEPVSSVEGFAVTTHHNNGFYKALAVGDEKDATVKGGNGIIFRYDIENEANELTNSEQVDLNALNTITLAELVGVENVSKNIIVSSSDTSIIKVVGSALQVLKTGDVKLTIASKQDVKNKKEINIKVIFALSNLMISWASTSGRVSYVEDNTTLILQKTHSRTYITSLENSQIYLGSLAEAYEIKQDNKLNLSIKRTGETENKLVKIDYPNVNSAGFRVITDITSIQTKFEVSPKLYESGNVYQDAIDLEFTRKFTINPIDGVISFNISGDALPITPSTNATLEVQIKTTKADDSVYPVIEYNGTRLISSVVNNSKVYNYTMPSQNNPIFTVSVNSIGNNGNNREGEDASTLKTFVYLLTFAVNVDYQSMVSQDMEFNVYIMSDSGNSSKEWNGEFTLSLTRQNFTNIDVSNRRITNSSYKYEDNNSGRLVEVHEAKLPTAVLAPGNSSVLQINVNPKFAYYDYVDLSYSGATVSEAVNIEVLKTFGGSANEFTRKISNGNNIETIGTALRYYPEAGEKGTLYYKLWVNTTVNRDSTLQFTARFYEAGGKLLSYVNYYLSVTYLTEPTVTIDGANTAYVAKGSTATVKIDVLIDQTIDNLLLDGEDIEGITLAPQGQPVPDYEKGIRTYTTTLYVSPTAKVKNGFAYVQAEVSRELNGSKEKKTAVATAVIVDFKVDGDGIEFDNSADNSVTIWQGVTKPISINYNLIPESYPNATDDKTIDEINKLIEKKEKFLAAQFYPVNIITSDNNIKYEPITGAELDEYNYFVNYRYNKIGNDVFDENKEDNTLIPLKLRDRLYVVSGNNRYPLTEDCEVDIPFQPIYDDNANTISLRGTRVSTPVTLVLMTYISAGGFTQEIETFFTVTVEAYSDPDLPLLVKNAKEFKNLAPGQSTSTSLQDYILTSDIVLQNYTPFNTSLIRSFDGNGHTIYIDSFDLNNTNNAVNLALFTNVSENTTLKNIRVNIYRGGQITIDTSVHKDISIAGFAIENEGVITNCEVVSYYTTATAKGEVAGANEFNYPAISARHNNPEGINVTYTRGANSDPIKLVDSADWTSQIAGFVINNTGSITNSRVGGDSVIIIGEDRTSNNEPTGYTYASNQQLGTFSIIGQGNISGFVISNNNGNIASCFVKNIDITNESDSTAFYTVGFVGNNTSTINVSYVEGVPTEPSNDSSYSAFANEGSSISSEKGYISGFVYNNEGTIKDSYSNILIASAEVAKKVYLASGFVYQNSGTIENGYSASQIKNSTSTQMNFSGVNNKGELLANGTYINCYFFNKLYEGSEESTDGSTETQNATGAMLVPMPDEASSFYGFAIANSDNDGVWKIEEDKGITLVSANIISVSHRYVYYIKDDSFEGSAAEDDKGKYVLPYAILTFTDENREIDTTLGGYDNPIIIVDAQDFVEVTGTSASSYIRSYFNSTAVWGTYRLVNDINLQDVASGDNVVILPTASKAFSGRFYGNGFTISGLSISSVNPAVSLGLFKSIEKRGKLSNPIIENLNIEVTQIEGSVVVMAGALAGFIKDAVVINIDVQFAENASVTGLNFVGGLTGFVFGNNIIKCINVTNPNVTAKANLIDDSDNINHYFISDETKKEPGSLQNLRIEVINSLNLNTSVESPFIEKLNNYSYAGGVIGFADLFSANDSLFDILQSENFNINNVRVSGTVRVEGQVAGGAFGLTGYQTNVRDVGVTIDGGSQSRILSTKYFAGGVIGQSFGSISRVFSVYDETTQETIENGMADFYNGNNDTERGNLDIFYDKNTNNTQQYIGGIVGAAFSGNMEVSYSKLNVTSPSATYAGGIVGVLDLRRTNSYQKELESSDTDSIFTSYYLNEVFATGDVRANLDGNGYAGGIIGLLIGENARVAFNSVNAYNYFAAYDYKTEQYQEEIVQTNFSEVYKFNTLVGHFSKSGINQPIIIDETVGLIKVDTESGKVSIDTSSNNSHYSQYINFVRKLEGTNYISTVSYYAGYYKNAEDKLVTMNLFGKIDGVVDDSRNPLFDGGFVYAIESPLSFTNSTAGSQYTNIGFLGSGVWNTANWEHKTGKLFISIKYKRISNIIYLDAFQESIEAALSCKGFETIYVRGLESPGSEKYVDVNLITQYYDKGGSKYLDGFGGRLRGGIYPLESATKVKIITDRAFIKNTQPGFSATDIEVIYTKASQSQEYIEMGNENGAGLFISGKAEGISIEGLTMDIRSPIQYTIKNSSSSFDLGLVAPRLIHSNVTKINILGNTETAQTLLNVRKTAEASGIGKTLNVGLVAGIAEQNSPVSAMEITDVNISALGNLISIDPTILCDNYNIGSYFGIARKTKDGESSKFIVAVDNLSKPDNANDAYNNISFMEANVKPENVNIGGYIGLIGGNEGEVSYTGINSIAITKKIKTAVHFIVDINVENLNVGGYVGNFVNGEGQIEGMGSDIDAGLLVKNSESAKCTISSLNAGGIVGLSSHNLKVDNFTTVEFGVIGYINSNATTKIKTQKEDLDGNYYELQGDKFYNVNVSESANIGGIIGCQQGSLSVTNIQSINEAPKDITIKGTSEIIQNAVNSFRVDANGAAKVTMGSVLGNFTGNELIIENNLDSYTEYSVINAGNNEAFLGGMVGYAGEIIKDSKITSKAETSYLRYLGAIYSNTRNLIFGGMIGYIEVDDNTATTGTVSKGSLTVERTVFGGVVKVFGENSNTGSITTGGTIGLVGGNSTYGKDNNISGAITLKNNYNFGDVFVEYSHLTSFNNLNKYNFGGLIGETNTVAHYINGNYSIMTSHNAKYSTTTGTVQALYGAGKVPQDGNGESTGINITKNYYNHAIVLANDENGTDLPLSQTLEDYKGYNSGRVSSSTKNNRSSILSVIQGVANGIDGILNSGKKLSPSTFIIDKNDGSEETSKGYVSAKLNSNDSTFHGMKYYYMSQGFDVVEFIAENPENHNVLNNIAIIGGNGNTFKNEKLVLKTGINAMIKEITGHSFVSGFAIDLDVEHTSSGGIKDYVAPLISKMTGNSILYAVNVKGTLDYVNSVADGNIVSGLVGVLQSGRIFDCSTDLDIIYRANENVADGKGVFGITKLDAENFKNEDDSDTDIDTRIIENTYSSGSIKTYIATNVYAFSNGIVGGTVNNCYAIPKLDLNDYTNENNSVSQAQIGVFGVGGIANSTTFANCYYDIDALNYKAVNSFSGNAKTHSSFMNPTTNSETKITTYNPNNGQFTTKTGKKWECDYDFNYGYPTLKYDYLKPSSYARFDSYKTKLQRLEEKDKDSNVSSEYDNYIIENSYTRLLNGERPANNDKYNKTAGSYFFMITNPALFSKMNVKTTASTESRGISAVNYLLKYDLDLKQIGDMSDYDSSAYSGVYEKAEGDEEYTDCSTIVFDGNNFKIDNLSANLFAQLGSNEEVAIVMNLNINYSATVIKQNAILANKAITTLISNVTITGDMTARQEAETVGGFVKELIDSEINTSTSLINISALNNGKNVAVGGFAGVMSGNSVIRFSSNYGPINTSTPIDPSTKKNKNDVSTAVGGLVGIMQDQSCKIEYSYNAASVLNNYATESSVCTTQGLFFTGGIVGYLGEGEISNSYNSGIIKSGNKNNIGTYDKNIFNQQKSSEISIGGISKVKVTYTKGSFAGGIMGFALGDFNIVGADGLGTLDANINNCYNEGNVEALGRNPSTVWEWSTENGEPILVLKQIKNSVRNVFAYGIGYAYTTKWLNPHTEFVNVYTTYDKESRTIYSNGTALEGEQTISTWYWADIIETNGLNTTEKYTFKASLLRFEPTGLANWSKTFNTNYTTTLLSCAEDSVKNLHKSGNAEVVVKSRNDLGIPVDFSVKIRRLVSIKYSWDQAIDGLIYGVFFVIPFWNSATYGEEDTDPATIEISDLYYGQVKNDPYLDLIIKDDASKMTNTSYNNTAQTDLQGKMDAIKNSVRSHEKPNNETLSQIQIADKFYILVDQNNNNDVFNSGINVVPGQIVIDTIDKKDENGKIVAGMPYLANVSYYNLDIENNTTNISSTITSIVPRTNGYYKGTQSYITVPDGEDQEEFDKKVVKMEVNYVLLSQSKIEGTEENPIKLKFTLNYSQKVTFDVENLKYYYFNDYSFAFKNNTIDPLPLENYKIKDAGGNIYDNVIRISKERIKDSEEEKSKLKDNSKFMYLAVINENNKPVNEDRNNKFIYIPNATLITPDGEVGNINKFDGVFNYVGLDEKQKAEIFATDVQKVINSFASKIYYNRVYSGIEFYRSVTSNTNGSVSTTLGGSVNNSITLNYGESISGSNLVQSVTEQSGEYTVTFKNQTKNVIGLVNSNDTTGVISYSFAEKLWKTQETYRIKFSPGIYYEAKVIKTTNNSITLKKYSGAGTINTNNIKEYFESLTYIRDTVNDTQTISRVDKVTTRFTIDGATLTLEGDFSKEWVVGGKKLTKENTSNIRITDFDVRTDDNGNKLLVTLVNKPNGNISFGGVNIFRGSKSLGTVKETTISNVTDLKVARSEVSITRYHFLLKGKDSSGAEVKSESGIEADFARDNVGLGAKGCFVGQFKFDASLYATFVKEEGEADEMLVGFKLENPGYGVSNGVYYVDASYKDNITKVNTVYKLIKDSDIIGTATNGNTFLLKSVVKRNYSKALMTWATYKNGGYNGYNGYSFDNDTGNIMKDGNVVPYDAQSITYFMCIIHDGLMYDFPILNYIEDIMPDLNDDGTIKSSSTTSKKQYFRAVNMDIPDVDNTDENTSTNITPPETTIIDVEKGEKVPIPNFTLTENSWQNLNINEVLKDTSIWESLKIESHHIIDINKFRDNYIAIIGEENFLGKGTYQVQGREKSYLYVKTSKKVVTSSSNISWLASGENYDLASLVKVKDVTYTSFSTSKYITTTEGFPIDSQNHELIITDERRPYGDFDSVYNWIKQGEKVNYYRNGNSFTIYLKKKDVNNIDIKTNINTSWKEDLNNISQDNAEPQHIVLTRNISFDSSRQQFAKSAGVNIIGNGHYISYFGSSFYTTAYSPTASNTTWIRDVKYLAEMSNKNSFFTQEKIAIDNSVEKPANNYAGNILKKVTFYGSIINWDKEENPDSLSNKATLINSNMNLIDFKTYVGITKTHHSITADEDSENKNIYLFNDIIVNSSAENYGVLIADYGDMGNHGASGSYNVEQYNDAKGENGSNGGSIIANKSDVGVENGTETLNMTNKGILINGVGGSGGAGGNAENGGSEYINTSGGAGYANGQLVNTLEVGETVNHNNGKGGKNGNSEGFSSKGIVVNRVQFDGDKGMYKQTTFYRTSIKGVGEENNDYRSQSGSTGRASFRTIMSLIPAAQTDSHTWGSTQMAFRYSKKSIESRKSSGEASIHMNGPVRDLGGLGGRGVLMSKGNAEDIFCKDDGVFNLDAPQGITYGVRLGQGIDSQGMLYRTICRGDSSNPDEEDDYDNFKYTFRYYSEPNPADSNKEWKMWDGVQLSEISENLSEWWQGIIDNEKHNEWNYACRLGLI